MPRSMTLSDKVHGHQKTEVESQELYFDTDERKWKVQEGAPAYTEQPAPLSDENDQNDQVS